MSTDDLTAKRADQEGANNAALLDDGLESRKARKAAILVQVQKLLTSDIYGNLKNQGSSTGKDGRLENLNVIVEFKRMLEEDKAMMERVLASSATEGQEEGKKRGECSRRSDLAFGKRSKSKR